MIWFGHIGMATKLRDIGWVYVLIGVLLVMIAVCVWTLIKIWREP